MPKKPSYEQLEQRVQELEHAVLTQQKCVEELKKYQNIVSSTSDGIAFLDNSYRYIIVNDAYERFSGVDRQHFLGLTVAEYLGKEVFKQIVKPNFDRCLEGEIINYQEWFTYPPLGKRFVDVTYFPCWDDDNHITGVIANTRDITEYKQIEEALRESETLYRVTMENILDPIFITDDAGTFTFICANVLHILGYTVEELEALGKISRLVGDDLFDPEELQTRGEIRNIERAVLDKQGRERLYAITMKRVSIQGGTVLHTWHDITERKQAEENLHQSEEKYRTLFGDSKDAVYITTQEGGFIDANQSALELLGYSRDELKGLNAQQLYLNPLDARKFQKKIEKNGFVRDYEVKLVKKDGTEMDCMFNVSVRRASDGSISAYQGIIRDITVYKKAEEKIKASLKEKELLLQEIHHRVKNNMQVISSLLKLQAETIKDERLRESFRDSEHRVRAMSLVHEKLYQSKDFTHIPFRDYLTSLIRYLYQSYRPQAKKIKLITEIEDLPLPITAAIPCGLVTNELLSNAFKHAFPDQRPGDITIALRSPEPHTYELTVSDNGISLPDDIDIHTTKTLGLHLVYILVEDQLKGEIMVERTGGTTFHIVFGTP